MDRSPRRETLLGASGFIFYHQAAGNSQADPVHYITHEAGHPVTVTRAVRGRVREPSLRNLGAVTKQQGKPRPLTQTISQAFRQRKSPAFVTHVVSSQAPGPREPRACSNRLHRSVQPIRREKNARSVRKTVAPATGLPCPTPTPWALPSS